MHGKDSIFKCVMVPRCGWAIFRLGLALVILSALWGSLPARAAQQGPGEVEVTASPALAGQVKYGEWTQLRIALTNAGTDLQAEVRVPIDSSAGRSLYTLPVELPSGARKELLIYVPPSSYIRAIPVQVVSQEAVVAETKVPVSNHPQNDFLVGVLGPESEALNLLNALVMAKRPQTVVIPLALDDLPERVEALRSLDALIVYDSDTTALRPSQAEALLGWVEQGGRLLIGGGAGAARTLAGLPEALRLVAVGDPEEIDSLEALSRATGEAIQIPGPFLATFPVSQQGRTILAEDGRPLLVQRAQRDGWVGYLALDPGSSPFGAWVGTVPFWKSLLEPGSMLSEGAPIDIPRRALEAEQMNYALQNLPSLDFPSIRWLGLLLGIYIVLVGPLNYFVLRRMRRLDWAWITIPALTLAFSLVSYGMGYQLRGNDVVVNQISILPISSDGQLQPVRTYVGLFSPSRQDYDVRVEGDALISAMSLAASGGWAVDAAAQPLGSGALHVVQGNPAIVKGLQVNQWAMQTFEAETLLDLGGPGLEADLRLDGMTVRGRLHNALSRPIEDLVLVVGSSVTHLGDLNAGETREVEGQLSANPGMNGSPFPWSLFELTMKQMEAGGPTGEEQRRLTQRQGIVESYFTTNWGQARPPREMMLFGWTDIMPLEVEVSGVRVSPMQTTMVVRTLPLQMEASRVSLPLGFASPRLLEYEGDAGDCGVGRGYLSRGRIVMQYELPLSLRGTEPVSMALGISSSDPNQKLGELAFYDWDTQGWVVLTDAPEMNPDAANVTVLDVPEPGRFLDPVSGAVRVQIRRDVDPMMGGGACYQFDLALDGTLP